MAVLGPRQRQRRAVLATAATSQVPQHWRWSQGWFQPRRLTFTDGPTAMGRWPWRRLPPLRHFRCDCKLYLCGTTTYVGACGSGFVCFWDHQAAWLAVSS